MQIIKVNKNDVDRVAPLVATFRVTLSSFKGIVSEPDVESGKEELLEFLEKNYPIFIAEENGEVLGYIVCKIDGPCVWVEHIFVKEEYRRQGVASVLFKKAEQIAESFDGDTVFNFVHPNNERMISFLRSKGYTVLNMVEIRKPYRGEKTTTKIKVGKEEFDY